MNYNPYMMNNYGMQSMNYEPYGPTMSPMFQRGTVTKITMETTYPDGSKKVRIIENPHLISWIALDEMAIPYYHLPYFNVSPQEWSMNPTMMVYQYKDGNKAVLEAKPMCGSGC